MEAIFLDCGTGGPQLKRNPLGGMQSLTLRSIPLALGAGLLATLPTTARQKPSGLEGCYELSAPSARGDVVYRPTPDSIRLTLNRSPSDSERFLVEYAGQRPRSQFNLVFRKQVEWQPRAVDSLVIFAPLGMWMEEIHLIVDSSGRAQGKLFLYTDVVSPDDTAQVGRVITGQRIRC